ncbi:MAG: hypothetical protein ACFFKA_21945 [Candidatus Thorarchaeota archaeon]
MGDSTDWEFRCFLFFIILFGLVILFLFLVGGGGAVGQFFDWITHYF